MSNEKLDNLTEEDIKAWGLNVANTLEKALQENRQLKRLLVSLDIPFKKELVEDFEDETDKIQ